MNWIDLLRQYLCQIYQEWGGECKNLGLTPQACIATVQDEYNTEGLPDLPTQGDRDRFSSELDTLEKHLDSPGNILSSNDDTNLRSLVASLRADLGALT